MNEIKIISVNFTENGEVEIVKQYPSNEQYCCLPPRPVPDRIVKEIYKLVDNRFELVDTIKGKHQPAYKVEETITFD